MKGVSCFCFTRAWNESSVSFAPQLYFPAAKSKIKISSIVCLRLSPKERAWSVESKSKSSLESALCNSVRKKFKYAIWMGEKKEEGTLFPNPFLSPQAQTLRWLHMKKGNDESQMFQENGARSCLLIARIGAAPLQPLCTIWRDQWGHSTINAQRRTVHNSPASWWAL